MSSLYLIWKNLTRKKLRLILLLFSITISFLIFSVLIAFQSAMNAGIDMSADDRLVVVNKINFTQTLPLSYMNRINNVEGVRNAVHLNWFGGYYQELKNLMPMFAVSNKHFFDVYDELVVDEAQQKNYLSNRQGLLIGEAVAKKFGWKVGDRVPIISNIYSNKAGGSSWDFDIAAIYKGIKPAVDTTSVYFHYEYFNESVTFGNDEIGFINVRTESPKLNEMVIQRIDELFINSVAETDTMPEKAFTKQFVEMIGNIGLIISSVVFAAFFTILLLVGNSMVMAIRERTNEIAVLKTLGFPSAKIFQMVLVESLMLVFIGGGIGLAIGASVLEAINSSSTMQLPPMMITGNVLLQAIAAMLALGLLTGGFPAWNALRLNLATAFTRA